MEVWNDRFNFTKSDCRKWSTPPPEDAVAGHPVNSHEKKTNRTCKGRERGWRRRTKAPSSERDEEDESAWSAHHERSSPTADMNIANGVNQSRLDFIYSMIVFTLRFFFLSLSCLYDPVALRPLYFMCFIFDENLGRLDQILRKICYIKQYYTLEYF